MGGPAAGSRGLQPRHANSPGRHSRSHEVANIAWLPQI